MRLFAVFAGRKLKRFSYLLPEFTEFHSNLVDIKVNIIPNEPLDALVYFFDETSRWSDRDLDDLFASVGVQCRQQHLAFFHSLDILQSHIACAGRTKFGWNRTEIGEVVTPENIFLGDVFGLFTHPVSFWKKRKCEEKGGWGFPRMEHLNSYDVVANQSLVFLKAHIDSMIDALDVLIEKLDECTWE